MTYKDAMQEMDDILLSSRSADTLSDFIMLSSRLIDHWNSILVPIIRDRDEAIKRLCHTDFCVNANHALNMAKDILDM